MPHDNASRKYNAKDTFLYDKCVMDLDGDEVAGKELFLVIKANKRKAKRERQKSREGTAQPASVASPPVGGADDEAPAPKRQKSGTLDGDGSVRVVEAKLHRAGWQTDCIVGVKVALETAKAATDTNVTLTLTQDGDSMVSVLA